MHHHKTLGQLVLDTQRLTHSVDSQITSIPLPAIRDVGIVHFPRSLNPLGLTALSVVYELDSKRHHILLMPRDRRVLGGAVNHLVREWHAALREAVRVATGNLPQDVEAAAVQLKGSSWLLLVAVLYFGFVGMILAFLAMQRLRQGHSLSDFVLHPPPWIILPTILFASGLAWIALKANAQARPRKPRQLLPAILLVLGLLVGTSVLEKGPARSDRNEVASRVATHQAELDLASRELQEFVTQHGNTLQSESGTEPSLKSEQLRLESNLQEARRRSETELALMQSHDEASNPLGRRQLKALSFAVLVPSPLFATAFLLHRRRKRIPSDNSPEPTGWRRGRMILTATLATGVLWMFFGPIRRREQPYNLGMPPSFEVRTSPEIISNQTVSIRFEVGVTNNPILLTTRFGSPGEKDGRTQENLWPTIETQFRLEPGTHHFQQPFEFPTHASAVETHRGINHDIHVFEGDADWQLFQTISSDGRVHDASVRVRQALPQTHPERVWWTSRQTKRTDAHWKQLEVEWTIASPIASQAESEFGQTRLSLPMRWDPLTRENRVSIRHRLIAEGPDRVRWIQSTKRGDVVTHVAMDFEEASYQFLRGVRSGGETRRGDAITLVEWRGKTEQIRITDVFWEPNPTPIAPPTPKPEPWEQVLPTVPPVPAP